MAEKLAYQLNWVASSIVPVVLVADELGI
jgi:hypothetical protein